MTQQNINNIDQDDIDFLNSLGQNTQGLSVSDNTTTLPPPPEEPVDLLTYSLK